MTGATARPATGIALVDGLTPDQFRAATCAGRDVLVTAGAGSGKTRTLVARYLWLVHQGRSPRRILAITFTEKAALEMRHRVRDAVSGLAAEARDPEARRRWADAESQMEAARIGTIHALCAEILRAHPAEAGVDPGFEVADEARTRLLQAQAVDDALAWAAAEPAVERLLDRFTVPALRRLLSTLLEKRLDARAAADALAPGLASRAVLDAVRSAVRGPLADPIAGIRGMRAGPDWADDASPRLAEQIEALLAAWDRLEAALAAGDWVGAAACLFAARREHMGLQAGGKASQTKAHLASLRAAYDGCAGGWLGGAANDDAPPDPAVESDFEADQARLIALFHHAEDAYCDGLAVRHALDFDDLEAEALALLALPAVRARWQRAVDAILVDECQDTNARQLAIVKALRGDGGGAAPGDGRLFVVGDARQSIYRFRGADVAAFQRLFADFEARGALAVVLDCSFRAHAALCDTFDALLPHCMGAEVGGEGGRDGPPGAAGAAIVGYIPLRADRVEPRAGVAAPFVELVIGGGADAAEGRPVAARALADRLVGLRTAGEFEDWGDVALLFRAASGFPSYEAALEARGIPFVTVAGAGFYERPETRDLLNILVALAEPWNDLAVAGLLRSPAFGLTDAALYHLRRVPGRDGWRPLRDALDDRDVLGRLGARDRDAAVRAVAAVAELAPLVDRLPVAEVLKHVIDRLDYRAVLATGPSRLWRNVDKLLADARASRLVQARAFLEYVQALRAVGVREGEAAAAAAGAVRLMTIHKAKGLEFPLTVIADAAYQRSPGGAAVLVDAVLGLAFNPDRPEGVPLAWRLAQWHDREAGRAETDRLLYVAATRACEKLLVSGHATSRKSGWSTNGWLKAFVAAAGIDLGAAMAAPGEARVAALPNGRGIAVLVAVDAEPPGAAAGVAPEAAAAWPSSHAKELYGAISEPPRDRADPDMDEGPARLWRVAGGRTAPGAVIGTLVHRAIERWCFPSDPRLETLLTVAALDNGLIDDAQRDDAIREATALLTRLRAHPLWDAIDGAVERRHEVPYTRRLARGCIESGAIDLLYRDANGWAIVDFKTDEVDDDGALMALIDGTRGKPGYRAQVRRYAAAVGELLGAEPRVQLCFLDYCGAVRLVPV